MKTTFNIDGAPTVSYIGKKAFEDRMTWNDKGELVLVKTNAEDGMEITAVRVLSDDGRVLVMVRFFLGRGCWGRDGLCFCWLRLLLTDTDASKNTSHSTHRRSSASGT